MEVDGMPVADDETVQFRDDERLEWTHVVHCKHIGDELRLLILRDGQELEVRYLLQAKKPLVPILHGVDCIPSYYTMGGLVFMPLSLPLLENAFGARKWRNVVPAAVLAAFNLSRAREEQQVGGWRGCVCVLSWRGGGAGCRCVMHGLRMAGVATCCWRVAGVATCCWRVAPPPLLCCQLTPPAATGAPALPGGTAPCCVARAPPSTAADPPCSCAAAAPCRS